MLLKSLSDHGNHMNFMLIPLIQQFTKETTIAMFALHPVDKLDTITDKLAQMLADRGYSRLYLLFLFTHIRKELNITSKDEAEMLNSSDSDLAVLNIVKDVGKVFFMYGSPRNSIEETLIQNRVNHLKSIIQEKHPQKNFFYFGELDEKGHPKRFTEISRNDEEHTFHL